MTRSVICSLCLPGQGDVEANDQKCSLFSVFTWAVMWKLMTRSVLCSLCLPGQGLGDKPKFVFRPDVILCG